MHHLATLPDFRPHQLPDFRLKQLRSDFNVREVPLLPDLADTSDERTHSFVWLRKSGLSTFDACVEVARFFGLELRQVESQGLKDEEAITHQVLSIERPIDTADLARFNDEHAASGARSMTMTAILGYSAAPCIARQLHGNVFDISIRDLSAALADRLRQYCLEERYVSIVNYYDSQRFGMPDQPSVTHLLGKAIVEADWDEARRLFALGGNRHTSAEPPGGSEEFFRALDPRRTGFFVSAYNSSLWNAAVSREVAERGGGNVREFEFPHARLFLPLRDDFDLSLKVRVDGHKIDPLTLEASHRLYTRHAVYQTQVFFRDVRTDELNPDRKVVTISFMLPSGCYATMLVAQLLARLDG